MTKASSELAAWQARGGNHVWLPYAQMATMQVPPHMALRTQGSQIILEDGRVMIDGVASWWTACHGYNHPHIIKAMQAQLEVMPHIMFGGLNHEPALKLATRLAAMTPGDLARVFFVDSGSVAVEVALKMAVQYWLNKGVKGRSRFISFYHGYHGDTTACMALCDPDEGMHAHFKGYLPENTIAHIPRSEDDFAAFDKLLEKEAPRVAALIIEPLVQGAGGMKFHDIQTLRRIHALCAKHTILFIADEIMTGFGRLGHMFACQEAAITPDIMCLGKALTGGTMSLAAAIARPFIFDAFLHGVPLMHGPTYMANPLACVAANASIDLFESAPRLQEVAQIEQQLRVGLEACRKGKGVIDVRVKGAIGVVEMASLDEAQRTALKAAFAARGAWVRPFHNIIYLMPAFTISKEELKALIDVVVDVLLNASPILSAGNR